MAPDGDMSTRGTRLWMIHPAVDAYRTRALKMLKRDVAVRDAFRADDLKALAARRAMQASVSPGAAAPLQKIGKAFGAHIQ